LIQPRFQADENFNVKIVTGVLRREPSVDFQTAKAANLFALPDPQVLAIAARENRILVTHDQKTMPGH
jgi:predicted nuclease of predicted toxin-antitoxin system